MNNGFELKTTDERGEGIFATKSFNILDVVMTGKIEKTLTGNHSHASQVGKHQYILHAGLIPKVNHSCEPNCGISLNANGAHDFIAITAIKPGEEITFDYAMRNYGVDYFPDSCLCGTQECRGVVTGWRDLPKEKKEAYKSFSAPYLLELD